MVLVDERTKSIVLQGAQETAARMVDTELRHGAIKLPSKPADILEVIEARYEMLVQRLYAQAMSPYSTDTPSAAAPAALPSEPAKPSKPAKSAKPSKKAEEQRPLDVDSEGGADDEDADELDQELPEL